MVFATCTRFAGSRRGSGGGHGLRGGSPARWRIGSRGRGEISRAMPSPEKNGRVRIAIRVEPRIRPPGPEPISTAFRSAVRDPADPSTTCPQQPVRAAPRRFSLGSAQSSRLYSLASGGSEAGSVGRTNARALASASVRNPKRGSRGTGLANPGLDHNGSWTRNKTSKSSLVLVAARETG
jgi:hypothetical protein